MEEMKNSAEVLKTPVARVSLGNIRLPFIHINLFNEVLHKSKALKRQI